MKRPSRNRLLGWLAALSCVGIGSWLVLDAFQEQLVFFHNPTEWRQKLEAGDLPRGTARLGGMVKQESLTFGEDKLDIRFTVTDFQTDIPVVFRGLPPALFREGQGVVAEGVMGRDGTFRAERLLAKHDENYMPPEVAKALRPQVSPSSASPADSAPPSAQPVTP